MDFQSAMETFAEAWVAANTKTSLSDITAQSEALALTRGSSTPPGQVVQSPPPTNGSNGAVSPNVRMRCSSPGETSRPTPPSSYSVASASAVAAAAAAAAGAVTIPPPTSSHQHHHHQHHPRHLLQHHGPASAASATSVGIDVKATSTSPHTSQRSFKDDTFDLSKSACGKSLPVHCVVETIYSLDETSTHSAWRRRPVVETDSYVIIPVNTVFQELVQVALHRLGYSPDSVSAAKGTVVIKNWKPLSFDKISDGPLVTVGDILGELTTLATLRIQMFRSRPTTLSDIKDKLLRLFLVQSHSMLLSTGCPLDELTLSQLCRGQNSSNYSGELSEEARRKFEQWWASQVSSNRGHHPARPQSASQYSSSLGSSLGLNSASSSSLSKLDRASALGSLDHVHPALQTVQSQYPTQKTRMRTSFDPELELPKLQSWFADNQHPSRQQIQQYVKELNSLESRRGRKPLDINNVVYWFKNARAAQKRAETRGLPPGNIPCHLGVNGYGNSLHNSNGGLMMSSDSYLHPERLIEHHVKSGSLHVNSGNFNRDHAMISEISNHESDMDDVEDDQAHSDDDTSHRSMSPTAPLSLTMSKNRDDNEAENLSPHRSSPLEVIKSEMKTESQRSPHSSPDNNNHHISDIDGEIEENDQQSLDDKRTSIEDDSLYKLDLTRASTRGFRTRTPTPTPDIDPNSLLNRPGSLDRLAAGFPLVPNSMFSHSIMYMSHYIPGLTHPSHNLAVSPSSANPLSSLAVSSADERRKRNRTFIDPVTEVPRLEQWFSLSTHPSHNLILKYTDELNRMPYRQKFPRLEPKNVQFWFKNRRAKCKRLKMALYDNPASYHCKQE